MLLIENKKGLKTYTIINKYLCECGLLNEKNVCNACMKYMKRKNVGVQIMTKKEFDLIKEVINERIKLDDIGPAVRLVTLYNRHELINDRVMERLFNCLRNGIYITCNMYDELN